MPSVSHFKLWNCNVSTVAGAQWVSTVCLTHIKMCREHRQLVKTSRRQQWALLTKCCIIACFFFLLGTKLGYTFQPPLQAVRRAVWLRPSYWAVGGRDEWGFPGWSIKPPIPPSPLFRPMSEDLADIIGAGRAQGRRSLCPWRATWAVLYLVRFVFWGWGGRGRYIKSWY